MLKLESVPHGSESASSPLKIESLDSPAASAGSLNSGAFDSNTAPLQPAERSTLKITKLSPAVRSENRVNVFVNDKFSFSLDVAQVVDFKLKVNQIITEADLKKCQRASEFGKLYQRSLEWVLSRPHSIKETRDYLYRRQKKREQQNRLVREREKRKDDDAYFGFETYDAKSRDDKNVRIRSAEISARNSGGNYAQERASKFTPKARNRLPSKELPPILDEDIDAVLERLIERGYLNDEKFAAYYLENRNATKGSSLRVLRQELQRKGIASDVIEAAFAESARNDESEIEKAIAKKRDKYDDEKLIAYLVRRGFSYDLAKSAVAKSADPE